MVRYVARMMVMVLALFSVGAHAETLKLGTLAVQNQSNLTKLSVGMSKEQAIKIMGTDNAETRNGLVPNPWTTEMVKGRDGGQYEVLYYITRKNPPMMSIAKYLTTPVIFRGGKLVGWSFETLEKLEPPKEKKPQ
jgi:hypothetical protein